MTRFYPNWWSVADVRHPFFASPRPLVFAHRGGSGLAPENTIAAFDTGLALGVDGLELDVRLSRDGVVVVHHDASLDRTTDVRGAVSARTAAELSQVDAGYRFTRHDAHPFRGRGFGVPALAEVLARYRGVRIVVELKLDAAELAAGVVQDVRRADAVGRVCVGSFDVRVLRTVRTLEPALATSAAREEVRWALYRSWCRWPLRRTPYHGFQIPEWSGGTRVVSRRFVEAAHRAGLGVHVWTVDTEDHACRLLACGVDGLITDRPDIIVPLVNGSKRL
jgi:glycerophosphoryl diester phosphodiesterase